MANDDHKQSAAVRRAIIAVRPDYFSWSAEVRERYRATMPESDRRRIRRSLLNDLFGIKLDSEDAIDQALEDFDAAQYLRLNSALLCMEGIGDDNIYLNEHFAEKTSLLDFDTLYDYDMHDYEYQEKWRREESPEYAGKPYRGDLHFVWSRLQLDGAFHYATLMSAARRLQSEIEDVAFGKIRELIPHEYLPGPNHGKRQDGGFVWDHRVDAGGMEAQLDELNHRSWKYEAARFDELLTEWDDEARGQVFIELKTEDNDDPQIDIVFSDKTALRAVRFQHFMADCRAIAEDGAELDKLALAERGCAGDFLQQAFDDIVENFDPRVVKFRKKRKVIMAPRAWDDLEQ